MTPTWMRAAALLATSALAVSIPTRALADSDEPDESSPSTPRNEPPKTQPPAVPAAELGLTGGMVFPTQMTPMQVFPTHTGVGPFIRFDATHVWTELIATGMYFSYSSHPVKTVDGFAGYDGSGTIPVASVGGTFKLRFTLSPEAVVRLGASIGINYSKPYIATTSGGENMSAVGFGLGALAELRYAVADNGALLFQLGFMSQPTGTATFPNDTSRPGEVVSFAFAPTFFFTVGPELFF
jgi:hypothetical protein